MTATRKAGKASGEPLLLRLAGDRSFQRGKVYFKEGRVADLLIREQTVTATVDGSRRYRVQFELGSGGIEDHYCSCPMGDEGDFCKHCVAVGLALLNAGEEASGGQGKRGGKREARPAVEKPPTWEKVAAHIWAMSQEDLAGLVLEAAKKEDGLYRRLVRATAAAKGVSSAAATCRSELADAFANGGFVDYYEAGEYARGIEEAVDSLEALLKAGAPSECMELAEFAFGHLGRAVGSMDDSDGHCTDIAERLSMIHIAACKLAKPHPETLAGKLFERELADEWGWWDHIVRKYATVLGNKGIAAFRMRAGAEWAKIPARGPAQERAEYDGRRSTIQQMMEDLATLEGDVEALVAILSHDLTSPYDFFRIATAYTEAHQPEKALDWAERGVLAFPHAHDDRLSDFLATIYMKRGRSEEAIGIIWRQFEASPWLGPYEKLKAIAVKAKAWPAWREKALALLRADLDRRREEKRKPWDRRVDSSTLVEIFLWEKDAEAAWAEAQAGGCGPELWLPLANLRERTHPEDAIPVYQRLIETHAGRKNNRDYEEATGLVKRVGGLLGTLGRMEDYRTYLLQLRLRHKPKRNFMKLLGKLESPG